ncbi:unnamed protein product [Kluyveromyces dobzhanskii CBS 2104]|uniref:WGS project CCBQ000000000 data, contig 00272 n=1 Tax=Kluyveromyces dobzhanskii CBS 2104 TaxID=1427455 RepID=A0A0A8L8W9_9SACH|nr:unnamed protein product [Kluyveromyces dobzhanskii CBS 2104]
MDALRQRHLKLLYRQRGSASRTIDYDVVIEPEFEQDERLDAEEHVDESFPDVHEDSPDVTVDNGPGPVPEPIVETDQEDGYGHVPDLVDTPDAAETLDLGVDVAQFDSMTHSQLSTPLTSMATIDVLRRLLETVIQETIEERISQFNRAGSGKLKFKLKLEIKVLQRFLEQCKQDMTTISELNLYNNDLLYRLKQISLLKNSLSQSLLDVRSAVSSFEGPNNLLSDEQVALHNFKRIEELIESQKTGAKAIHRLPPDTSIFDSKSENGLLQSLKSLNESIKNING